MPVVVTGASGLVGGALVRALVPRGGEVRVHVRRREAAEPLRSLGAKVAIGDPFDVGTLALVMSDAHTVCHLAGGLDLADEAAYERANLGTTLAALEAAADARVTRFLFLSYPGADPASPNAYLRAKGAAEEAVRASGLEHVIVRATHVYGRGSRWLDAMRRLATGVVATVVGPGDQRVAPVAVDDVAAVLGAADDRARELRGTFGLGGPDVVTADELVTLLAGRRRRPLHLSPGAAGRITRALGRPLSPTMLEVLAADSLPDAPAAAEEFGVDPSRLADGLMASTRES